MGFPSSKAQGFKIEWHLRTPLVEGVRAPRSRGQLALLCVGEVPFRPLGKSNLRLAPWSEDSEDEYKPTVMEFKAIQLGCVKCLESQEDYPEDIVRAAQAYLISKLKSIWTHSPDEMVLSMEDAVSQLTMDKSPGYDYFFKYKTKADALMDEQTKQLVYSRTDDMMQGKKVNSVFGLTLKSELRPKDKVEQLKTRIFAASDLHHLLASTRLYAWQNYDLMEQRGKHPITIGLRMPSPEFVDVLRRVGDTMCDADLSGCDQRFPLRLARSVCDIRHHFLPERYRKAGRRLYSRVYSGLVTVMGKVYVMPGNKSGWHNTGHDNSLMSWLALACANFSIYNNIPIGLTFNAAINGDDWLYKQLHGDFSRVVAWLSVRGVVVETDFKEKSWKDVVFLSHHVRTRYVDGFGDFYVTAGNLSKLKSSVNWVKIGDQMTYEEYCVAHLIGLRICMFPFPDEFRRIDKILTRYLSTISLTEVMSNILTARFTEFELAGLHTRTESLFSQCPIDCKEVLKSFDCLFKINHDENEIAKETSTSTCTQRGQSKSEDSTSIAATPKTSDA